METYTSDYTTESDFNETFNENDIFRYGITATVLLRLLTTHI